VRYLRTKLATNWSQDGVASRVAKHALRSWNPTSGYPFEKIHAWFIEFEDKHGYANREVGLDVNGEPVCSNFPDKFGFWCGEDMQYDDFIARDAEVIAAETFESAWVQLVSGEET